MYEYPYGNAQQLNLDWILNKLKELEQNQGQGGAGADLEEVANALVSLTYDSSTNYRRYDYAYRNGKLYRCLTDTTGTFNPAAWMEVTLGADIPVLTRLLNAVDASLTSLQNTVNELDSDDIENASNTVSGNTVTEALDNLKDSIDTLETYEAYRVTGTISSSSLSITKTGVTADMVPVVCEFGTPANVLSNYTITTAANTVTFSGITLGGSTTVDIILIKAN